MSESEIRAQFLTRALESRKLIEMLTAFLQCGETKPGLKESLKQAADLMRATNSMEATVQLLQGLQPSPFGVQSGDLKAIEEAKSAIAIQDIEGKIDALATEADISTLPKQYAYDALNFFSALETRAIRNFNQSLVATES